MTTQVLAVVAAVAFAGIGGNVWLLAQESRGRGRGGRSRRVNTRVLKWLAILATSVVLATCVVARPWYWDVAVGSVAVGALAGVLWSLRALWRRPHPARRRSVALAAAAVLAGVALLVLAGVAAVLDIAAVSASEPQPIYHGGAVLARPVLYQLFWGAIWDRSPTRPAVAQAVAFDRELGHSAWAASLVSSGFGISSVTSGGCWIDPSPPAHPGVPATNMQAGPLPVEIRVAFSGRRRLTPCPGSASGSTPPVLPADALVALWLPPDVPYRLGGVAAHGAVAWPGRREGLAATGLPGAYAEWGLPSCARHPDCRDLPSYAPPTYALSHEVVETITDPFGGGWFADAPLGWTARYVLAHGPPSLFGVPPVYPGEVSDLCQPGEPGARGRVLVGRLDPGGPPVSPFFRRGRGCGS